MKLHFSSLVFSLALLQSVSLAATVGSKTGNHLFDRAVGDTCKAPEGQGSCIENSKCVGITYKGLCPKDAASIQCCVKKACKVGSSSGYCRSKSRDGCSGGSFHAGHCPGPTDIQCCIKKSAPAPPKDCRSNLSCTFSEIEAMTMSTRLDYVRTMQSKFFGPLHAGNQFRAIEGIIKFFVENDLGKPNTWISYVDAGIVEGIQNGGANTLGLHKKNGGNPGTEKWTQFLQTMKNGGYANRDKHDNGWSVSEQAATDYGKQLGDRKFVMSTQEKRWYFFSQIFRKIMRNHQETINACRVVSLASPSTILFAPKCDNLVNWLTDITKIEPTLCLSKAVWDGVDPNNSVLKMPFIFGKILGRLKKCFEEN